MNNLTPSSTGSFITFRGFDKEIEAYLEPKIPLSHKLINQIEIPIIVDALREYLIRNAGCFTIKGFYRPSDLSIWYDREALIEEFDDLLIKFKDFIYTLGVDTGTQYTLIRYQDNLNFIMVDVVDNREPEFPSLDEENELRFKYALEEAQGHLEAMISRMQDKFDYIQDPDAFVKELIGDRLPEVLRRHLI
uniref:Uncharacterized protein n=1 Tax=Pantoea phage Survivor TaxID=3232176 RepID=A0AAU8KY18_9CAUD